MVWLKWGLKFLVEESCVDELLQEELYVTQLRILDTERFQHPNIPIFNSKKHRTEVLDIRPLKVQWVAKIFNPLRLCKIYLLEIGNW